MSEMATKRINGNQELELDRTEHNGTRTTVIEAARGLSALRLREVWEYKDLLYLFVWRDLKTRYRQTALGPLWVLINPLVSMILYTILFGGIAKLPSDGKPYAIFSYAALLPWTFLNSCVGSGSGSLQGSTALISKVYFPRLLIPLSQIIGALIDFGVSFLFLIVLMVYFGVTPTWGLALIPVYLLVTAGLGLGVGLWMSGIIVRFRDFGSLIGYGLRVWMYASPVVYSSTLVPQQWQGLYQANPMTSVIEGFRWALLGTAQPPFWALGVAIAITLPILATGMYHFKHVERTIIDFV